MTGVFSNTHQIVSPNSFMSFFPTKQHFQWTIFAQALRRVRKGSGLILNTRYFSLLLPAKDL